MVTLPVDLALRFRATAAALGVSRSRGFEHAVADWVDKNSATVVKALKIRERAPVVQRLADAGRAERD